MLDNTVLSCLYFFYYDFWIRRGLCFFLFQGDVAIFDGQTLPTVLRSHDPLFTIVGAARMAGIMEPNVERFISPVHNQGFTFLVF